MKTFSLTLSDARAAELDAALASGEFASVAELVETALDALIDRGGVLDDARLEREIDAYLARRAAGEQALPADAAFDTVLAALRG